MHGHPDDLNIMPPPPVVVVGGIKSLPIHALTIQLPRAATCSDIRSLEVPAIAVVSRPATGLYYYYIIIIIIIIIIFTKSCQNATYT